MATAVLTDALTSCRADVLLHAMQRGRGEEDEEEGGVENTCNTGAKVSGWRGEQGKQAAVLGGLRHVVRHGRSWQC